MVKRGLWFLYDSTFCSSYFLACDYKKKVPCYGSLLDMVSDYHFCSWICHSHLFSRFACSIFKTGWIRRCPFIHHAADPLCAFCIACDTSKHGHCVHALIIHAQRGFSAQE